MASMRLLMLCLFTCVAYLVTFNIETIWTKVLHCEDCVAMSWFILVLIQYISLVVAVPVNQWRAVPRKGNKLLLCRVLVCSWLEFRRLMVEVIVVLLDWYMSCMLDNSSWSVVSSCVGTDGCWSMTWGIVVCWSVACWKVSSDVPNFWVIHVQWWSKSAWWGMLVKLVERLPILWVLSEMSSRKGWM